MFAPFCSNIKNYFGTKNTILIGFFFLTMTTIALGYIAHIYNAIGFLSAAIALRFIQGFGDILL